MADGKFFSELFPQHPFVGLSAEDFPQDEQNFFFDPEVFADMIAISQPRIIIEVGTWKGHSANAMADICKQDGLNTKIICVDTWLGSQEHYTTEERRSTLHIEHGRPTLWERFIGNTIRRSNHDCIYPLALPASTAAIVMDKLEVKADLIYIDAGHDYDDVSADIRNYASLLEPDGVMFGDDFYLWPLEQAVRDFAAQSDLGIARKGSKWVFLRRPLNALPGYETVVPIC